MLHYDTVQIGKGVIMFTIRKNNIYGIIIGVVGGIVGVYVSLFKIPSFITRPTFYGPLIGILGGLLGVAVAIKNESDAKKKRRIIIIGISILSISLLFWLGVKIL